MLQDSTVRIKKIDLIICCGSSIASIKLQLHEPLTIRIELLDL
ncbi:hypothetical protein EV11_1656 [Prochlorococcus sp. SS52]|nr:hypothetical protein EV04_0857 [Prochlorococcus marinus str. LG]KGG21861.1 hypothetical protein EV08_0466 [Prochlorococcus marinus str. SS2]KGG23708.1 hypothetical protein EV09_1333 [Prochlorococcus marinus str. SS35]KGG32056.1 hypothetical protein EV10_1170 [Prochlorococcus marinus str. SS51]KGG35253.1 hypothetical protein EV11_1656 [Prochlorococcus sp. SS52]